MNLRGKGLRQNDLFNQIIVRAQIHVIDKGIFENLVLDIANSIALELNIEGNCLKEEFLKTTPIDPTLIFPEVYLLYSKVPDITRLVLYIVLCKGKN